MTIKNRLIKSNILMVLLPVIATTVMFFALTGMFGLNARSQAQEQIGIVNENNASTILQDRNYTEVTDDFILYRLDTGEYVLVLSGELSELVPPTRTAHPIVVTFTILIVIVFFTNRVLTKNITNYIMNAINVLTKGVNEISEGNLTYRINYNKDDEFDSVCKNFNEMASHLLEMVQQRQMDEDNRKELIAGISHDLRTPLTSIKAYIEGIRKGVASTPEMQEKYLDTIQKKTEDIEYIINQLFLFSKMDIGDFPINLETVDIGKELEKMTEGFAYEYREKGLAILLEKNVEKTLVSIDIVQFRNVVQNILDNSAKYCNKEDIITEIICTKDDENVFISIKDNGVGIPEESLSKIFEIFYRADISRNNPSKRKWIRTCNLFKNYGTTERKYKS